MPVKVILCYAREDEKVLNQLKEHLKPLEHEGLIELWHDRDIRAGEEWESHVGQRLDTAQVILLLISSAFMSSKYCYETEMKRALVRHERGEACVIPVIARHVYWQGTVLGRLQVLPRDGLTITDPEWHDWDRALRNVTEGLHKVVVDLLQREPRQPSSLSPDIQPTPPVPLPTSGNNINDTLLNEIAGLPPTLVRKSPMDGHSPKDSGSLENDDSDKEQNSKQAWEPPQQKPLGENGHSQESYYQGTIETIGTKLPKRPLRQNPIFRVLAVAIVLLGASGIVLAHSWNHRQGIVSTPSPTPTVAPISHRLITLNDREPIIIGISDGSNHFSFTTTGELHPPNKPHSDQGLANGEDCIYRENARIASSLHITVIAVATLSNPKGDGDASFEWGNDMLQGLCQKQIYYNKQNNTVKVRILVANIGTEDPPVLQQTMPIVTQQLIQYSKQDSTFIGAVGFTFSASLYDDDSAQNIHINTMEQLKKAHIPVISTSAASSDSTFSSEWAGYFYRMDPGADPEGAVAANYAHQHDKTTAFVFYNPDNPYSRSLESAFTSNFQGTSTGPVSDPQSKDFQQYLRGLIQHPPDLIYCACFSAGTTPDFSVLQSDLQAYPALQHTMLMGGDALYTPESASVYRNVTFTSFAFPDTISYLCGSNAQCMPEEQTAFYATYCQTFAPDTYKGNLANCQSYGSSRPSLDAMLGYDALGTLLAAYQSTANYKSASTVSLLANVVAALPFVQFQGVTGWIQLNGALSDPVRKMILLISVDANGIGGVVDYCGDFTPTVQNFSFSPQQNC